MFHMILNKVIYNFSENYLTDSDESLLIKGLKFTIPPKKIEYSKLLLPFELLFCDIKSNSESSVYFASIKALFMQRLLLQDTAFNDFSAWVILRCLCFFSIRTFDKKIPNWQPLKIKFLSSVKINPHKTWHNLHTQK